jgi:hypothetical protein
VNYFAPLAHAERIPLSREQVWKSLRGHGRLACAARKRILERQISEDAQVEQDESSTRNIKSNLTLASRTDSFQQGSRLLRRGERTVPRRYIKSAHWLKVGDDEGYFAVHKGVYFPIEFNYEHCYWYCVKYSDIRSTWETLQVAPSEYFLDIQDDEVVPQSNWGLLDSEDTETDNKEGPSYCFGEPTSKSQQGGPEDIDVQILAEKDERYEAHLQELAAVIPVLTHDKTKSYPTFASIMATQTQTRSIAATGKRSYGHAIKRSGPPGGEPPSGDPFRGLAEAGRAAGRDGGGGGGGGGSDRGDPDDPNHRGRRHAGSNGKLSGKEPTVFTGDRKDAKSFILEWQIYQMLNYDAAVMCQPFTRAMLFLSFIKGPAVHKWNMLQVNWLMTCARTRALPTEEFLYDTIEVVFRSAFTDTMSVQRAKAEFQLISMERGDLDGYVSKFEQLARLAGYDLNSSLVLNRFGSKLIPSLYAAIVNGPDEPVTWTDWVRAAQKYQQKYLLVQANLGDGQSKDPVKGQKNRSKEQWQQALRPKPRDPNAMEIDRVRARQITMDERAELMKAGKCFTCCKQGHLSHDCPQCSSRPRTNVPASTSQVKIEDDDEEEDIPKTRAHIGKTKYLADEIIEIMRNTEDDDKDEVIQKVFIASDF